jgi:hypothetical protein
MKAVQIGILAVLIVCAGLLFKVYRGQQQAAAAASTSQTAAPATAATPAPAAPAEAAPAAQPTPEATAETHERKPSPTRRKRPVEHVEVAQYQPPAEPAPAVAPAQAPPPQAEPAPPPQPALNPPSGAQTEPPPPPTPHTVTIPAGTLVSVRLNQTLTTEKSRAGDSFSATLDQPLIIDGFAIAERGAHVQGKVLEVQEAGRVKGVAMLAVGLTRLHTSDGQDVQIQTERFSKEGPTSKADDVKKIGAGAAIGAAIGAIAGGGKGAAIGAGVGGAAGGGVVAATRGKPAELPVETRLTFRLQNPVTLTEQLR